MESIALDSRVISETRVNEVEYCEVVYPAKFWMPRHDHPTPQVVLILSGAVEHHTGRDRLCMTENSGGYLPPGQLHSDVFLSNTRAFQIDFRGGRPSLLSETCPHRMFQRSHPAAALMTEVFREFKNPDCYTPLMLESLTNELLVSLLRQSGDEDFGDKPHWLDRVRDLLHEEFSENLRLEKIALEVGVHPAHLTKAFRRRFGLSIGDYIRQLRVARARQLLEVSDLSIGEIAAATGFADHGHFTRTFKKYTGQTPKSIKSARP
ncbi:MAG: helix-turn-helix domain-containing protein [Armatimonadetes bacterium]|nr:helix-turn-helix domain-containing protein [Armatimonadota bacterium]